MSSKPNKIPGVSYESLPPKVQAKVRAAAGVKRISKSRAFTAEQERRHALRVLATIAELSQDQRRRVLARALKVNDI